MSRATVHRLPQRASYSRSDLDAVLDAGILCHVGIVDGGPVVVPMAYARDGDRVLLHGSAKSRIMRHVAAGHEVCIAVTHLDGLVLAKSVFNHSMNYRSAVVFGRGRELVGEEKMRALEVVTEHLAPGRWAEARHPNAAEEKATSVVAVAIDEFSIKTRTGGPRDAPGDADLAVWAGVIERRDSWTDPRPTGTRSR